MSDVLTVDGVADLLCCDPDTVREKTRTGTLPGVKFGRDWVYPRAALLDALNELARQKPEREVRALAVSAANGQRGRPRKVPPVLPVLP